MDDAGAIKQNKDTTSINELTLLQAMNEIKEIKS